MIPPGVLPAGRRVNSKTETGDQDLATGSPVRTARCTGQPAPHVVLKRKFHLSPVATGPSIAGTAIKTGS